MAAPANTTAVRPSADQRAALAGRGRTGTPPAHARRRPAPLLRAAAGRPAGRIAAARGVTRDAVWRVRARFAAAGPDATPPEPRAAGRQRRKLDDAHAARLAALAGAEPPAGPARWTMRRSAGRAVALEAVAAIGPAAGWRTLKKTTASRGRGRGGGSRPRPTPRASRRGRPWPRCPAARPPPRGRWGVWTGRAGRSSATCGRCGRAAPGASGRGGRTARDGDPVRGGRAAGRTAGGGRGLERRPAAACPAAARAVPDTLPPPRGVVLRGGRAGGGQRRGRRGTTPRGTAVGGTRRGARRARGRGRRPDRRIPGRAAPAAAARSAARTAAGGKAGGQFTTADARVKLHTLYPSGDLQ